MNIRIERRTMCYGAESKTFETARVLRKNMTLAELVLWKRLKNRELFKTKFRRQHPVNIFIVDFYCHEFRLAIELDGEIHQDNEKKKYYDGRTAELERFGIKIIRFFNDEDIYKTDEVINRIIKIITELTPFRGAGGVVSTVSPSPF